ncbi:guanine-nucleotide dissociation stimulator CDC25 [Microthyrium microscopicum]|uniref:Class E vacuolar protein-sorting machinery protein HSE1 n=1 Tax=Microthyrium microscopicum TaxID=703497 RepID=A0A6A6U553_9PEZI|nr:guanine-nucleotide dissociation stimulator CDC25 [Microthyrium microscopicum]
MNGHAGAMAPPGAMYVQALYDYDADDQTSLSFRAGDIIQVITQLESGWWDGFINGVRGWFPSNYCQLLANGPPVGAPQTNGDAEDQNSQHQGSEDGYEDLEYEEDSESNTNGDGPNLRRPESAEQEQEEAAFWIPQATPEGRLYYYNTLTGVTRMELPLETFSAPAENGPRERNNVYIPDSTRPPPERMAGGYERDDDTDYENSGSDPEPRSAVEPHQHNRRSSESERATRETFSDSRTNLGSNGLSTTSFTGVSGGPTYSAMPRQLFDDGHVLPLTWNKLLEDLRSAVDRFRYTVDNNQRSEIVRRAEDISDHLRLLLSAGSGTTDNHSGNPSIISSNKALYPIFRETMSRFSKLVLSSHIAAADYPPLDAHAKCLKEAEGMMNAVYGFVDVARKQRGEDIPRVIPGFVTGSNVGGAWRNNALASLDTPPALPFSDQDDYDVVAEPNARLDSKLVDRLEDLQSLISQSCKKLDEQLVLNDKLITPLRHKLIGDTVCKSCVKVLEIYRPFISTMESINLSPLSVDLTDPQIKEYNLQKQMVYNLTMDLMITCQSVASPLADEWAEAKRESLEDRMKQVSAVLKDMDMATNNVMGSVRMMADMMPMEDMMTKDDRKRLQPRDRAISNSSQKVLDDGMPLEAVRSGGTSKLERIFGELPAPLQTQDVPEFLRLDHEGEITYDMKVNPPQLRGGTLTGLIEQLTRHDRHNSDFNNTFLLTYKSFTNAEELFGMLVKRWSIQPPYGIAPDDYQTWVDQKQKPIQFRVVNILKTWLDTYWMEPDCEESRHLLQRMSEFAKNHVSTTNTPGAAPLITAIEQRMKGEQQVKRLVLTLNTQTPTPILPRNMRRLKFLDIDPIEFARQLTIIESRLYGKIRPIECLNKTWNKTDPNESGPHPAANLKQVILHSNQLTSWVAQMILTQADVKKRCIVIKHFVAIADKCRQHNNFSTLTSIISAFGTAPIHRLQRTWKEVKGNTKETLESLRKLMASSRNFAEYRETLHKAQPPCTPFLGVYLTDLTFIEDGISSNLKKNNLINFAKRAKTAEVIRDIQQYQNVPYSLQPVPELQDYITTNMRAASDVAGMYDLSLQVEPREREEDRVARLLSESGFL